MAEITTVPVSTNYLLDQASKMKPRLIDTWILPGAVMYLAWVSGKKKPNRWLRRIVFTGGIYMVYRNINLVRYFPTASMQRSGFPQYRETNCQPGFRKTLKAFIETGLKDLLVDFDLAVEANEYRRQIPDFNTACVLRQRMYV